MPLFDLPLDRLREYLPRRDEPTDFDTFWQRTFAEAATVDLDPRFRRVDGPLRHVVVEDVRFTGWGGDPVNGWLILPPGDDPVGCVVKYLGYGRGRGFPHSHLAWPVAGWAVLVVDTRGQGAASTEAHGATADPHGISGPQVPGMLTNGISSPETYYYRRVITDAMRAVDTAAAHPRVDTTRLVTAGHSQGGALSQAVGAMHERVRASLIDEPFLTHFRRAAEIASAGPYPELVEYLASQRDQEERVFTTLSYFDGMNFASRARTPAYYSVSLMDEVCPPSTVFAGHNHWAGPKQIQVWPWNGHEGGQNWHLARQLDWLDQLA